ncbi:MAG: IPT/TIG domain-containing protein, partial [Bryobacteraceae bacterium]
DARTFRAPNGSSYDVLTQAALFTAGGSAINRVTPRAGTVPAGGTIDVTGVNFVPGARVRLKDTASTTTFISSTQLQVTPSTPYRVDGTKIRLDNGDGSQDVHYSYRKGTPVRTSTVPLIRDAEPMFPDAGPAGDYYSFAFSSGSTRTAIALQNPGTAATTVSIQTLSLSLSPAASTTVDLPPNGLVFLDAGELVPGASAAAILRLRVTQPVQMLQMIYNNGGFASPSLPQRIP